MFVIEEQNYLTRKTTLHVEHEHFTDAVPAYMVLLRSHGIDAEERMARIGQDLREHGHHHDIAGNYGLSIETK